MRRHCSAADSQSGAPREIAEGANAPSTVGTHGMHSIAAATAAASMTRQGTRSVVGLPAACSSEGLPASIGRSPACTPSPDHAYRCCIPSPDCA